MESDHHSIYIISTHDFFGKSAGSTRMRYYARALANKYNSVYLISCCSTPLSESNFIEVAPQIFVLKEKKITLAFFGTIFFLRRLNKFSNLKKGSKTFLLYPTVFISFEILALIYLKFYKSYTVFYELNEVRKYSSSHEAPLTFQKIPYSLEKIAFKIIFTITQPFLYFYNGLVCISTSIENYGKKFNNNTLRIPILTDSEIKISISTSKFFDESSFNIGFSGSIDPIKEDLANFIAVIEELNEKGHSVSFNLCGSISKNYKENFLGKCKTVKKLNYYGFLDEPGLSAFLSQQNLLVLPRGYTRQNNYGFSTKLSDYLNHKKMVLVTDISDNSLYVEDNVNGFVVPPNDRDAMYQKIKHIIEKFDLIENRIISNAQNTSKLNFDYRLQAVKLRNFLKEI